MNLEIEKEIFKQFLDKDRKKRFLWMIESPKRRDRIFEDLRDERYFDENSIHEVEGAEKFTKPIIKRLKSLGMGRNIYVICSDDEHDGTQQEMSPFIEEYLWGIDEIIGYCSKSKVGFFKNHEDWFFILRKSS